MEELLSVESFFKSHQVHLSRVWLESCIQWCKEENLLSNYTLKDLQFNVFEQWLLLDLRDVEVACLPLDISSKVKYVLQDNYVLQVMQVVDISKPKYFQLQRIRNGIPKNLEQESENSKRVLQLTLTDGVQEVIAVEYKPVDCLNLNLSPGIKIRLTGPIQVRRGRLMLENKHVKIIGGEVDTLLVSNAAENILAKSLNQPLNNNPQIIQESILTADTNIFDQTGFSSATQNRSTQSTQNNVINNTILQNQRRNNQFESNRNTNIHTNSTLKLTTTPEQFPNADDFEDDFKLDSEIEMLMEAERDFEDNISAKPKSKTPDLFEDDFDFETIDIPNTIKHPPSKNEQPNSGNSRGVINISDIIDIDEGNKNIENTTPHFTTSANAPLSVVWSVEKLIKTIPNVTNGKFKIRAKFKKITEKMTVVDESFHLVAEVEDVTASVALKFHSDVVSDLIGFTVQEFMGLREEWMRSNAEAKNKVLGALDSLKNRLTDLDDVLEVLVNSKEKFPILVKIF